TFIGVSTLTGCTQMPTEKRGVADMRPQIAFKADSERLRGARVILDGLDVGSVGDYPDGAAAVRILPGAHALRVVLGAEVLLDERFYLGDGVNRTFIVK
ncbi:MAG: hypothetical protein ACREX0_14935, partial [Noviherbaspirillum sp.]